MEAISGVFSKYANDNKAALAGVGVIATIAALFLNLSPTMFGSSLKNLQLLLLLFLVLSLISLTFDTLFWFKNNADSSFAGLVVYTLALTVWRIIEFVLENFRTELNQYLALITISVTFIVWSVLLRLQKKMEINVDRSVHNALLRALFYGLTSFFFFYLFILINHFYGEFSSEQQITLTAFAYPLEATFTWAFPVLVAVAEFSLAFFFSGKPKRVKLAIFLVACYLVTFIAILYPTLEDLFALITGLFMHR